MDSDSFIIPNLGTLRRQVTSLPSMSGSENVVVSWEGRIQLASGERIDFYLDEDDMPFGEEARRELLEGLTRFFVSEEGQLRHEVAAELLDLVNLARRTREHPAPPLTLDTLLPRLTLEDVDWGDRASSATYRVDEPEFEGRSVRAEYDEEGHVEVRTTLMEMLPPPSGPSASFRVPFQARVEAARAALEASMGTDIPG